MSSPLTTRSDHTTAETTRGVTATQESMWFDARHDPDSVHLHVSFAVRLDAPVEPSHADTVIRHAIDTFDDLRSVFVDVDGRPERRILPAGDVAAWRCDDISADDLDDALRQLHCAPFDVENGPLVRFQGYLLPDDSMVVAIVAHHLVVDLWTVGLLGAWLAQAYAAVRRSEPMPPLRRLGSFHRHVEIESTRLGGSDRAAALEHWRPLVDHSRPTTLVDDGLVVGPRPGLGDVVPVRLDREVEIGIRDLADRLGTSIRSVVLAALDTVLHRTLGSDRVTVIESKANRTGATARTLGCCLNQVLRVSEAESSTTVAQLIGEVDRQTRASRPHDWLPLSTLMHETGRPTGSVPATEVAFSWQKSVRLVDPSLARSLALGDRSLDRDRESVAAASMPVRSSPAAVTLIGAGDGGSVTLALEYQVERFARSSIELLGERLARVLRASIIDPDVPVDDVDLIGSDQRERQRSEFGTLDSTTATSTVSDLVDERMAASPDSVAIRHRGRRVTYAELGRRTDRIAEVLAAVDGDDPIGVLTSRSVDMVAAVLAVWRSGRGFVPLDPSYPAARLGDMIGDAGVSCVVVDATTVGAAELVDVLERPSLTVVDLDDVPDDPPTATDGLDRTERAVRPASSARPDGLAHVYFTSGSTGRPKGVAVTQASLAGFLRSMCERIELDENDVVAASTTLSFDPALLELVGTLVVGGEVLLIDRDTVVDPVLFGRALGEATLVQATPTVYRMLIENGWTGHDRLAILCGGEPMTPQLAADLSVRGASVWNLYGPTETTVWATADRVEPGHRRIGLGRPLPGVCLHVLDEHSRPVPDGTIGELWIGGDGVAIGYVGRPDLTAERFVDDPFVGRQRPMYRTGDLVRHGPGGVLEFHGRTDSQVKVRGHRIELGEIEAVLESHRAVVESVATVVDDGADARLVAFVRGETDLDATDLRHFASRRLPRSMLPGSIAVVERFARTPSGKIDRRRLPQVHLDVSAPESASESASTGAVDLADPTLLDATLAIYREVLDAPELDADADFFDSGGHSLDATRIISRLESATGRRLPIRAVFDHPSPRTLAVEVERTPSATVSRPDHGPADAPDPSSSDDHTTSGSLTPSQRRMWFAQAVDPSSTTYNLAAQIRVRGGLELDEVRAALAAVVADQPALRSAFSVDDGDIVSTVHPDVVPRIDVVDRRSVDGVEARIAAARSRIVELARAPFDLSRPPLVRFTCDVIDADDLVFGVVIHHIIADQWSFGVLLDAVGVAVAQQRGSQPDSDRGAGADGEVADVFVSPWIERVEPDEIERQMEYWRGRLGGLSSLELPLAATSHRERPASAASDAGDGVLLVSLDDGLRSGIDAYAAARGATGFMVYASTLALLLSEVAGSDDIPIGMPIANRHHLDTERTITSLVNTLVLRIDTSGRVEFDELLAHVRDCSLEAYDHQDVPFDRIVGELSPPRAGVRSPFFQVFLNVHNAPIALPSLSGAHFDILPVEHRAVDFDLSLTIDPELTGVLRVEFDPRQVTGDSAAAWSSRFIEMLHRVVSPVGPPTIAELRSTGAAPMVAAGELIEVDDPAAEAGTSVPAGGPTEARSDRDERRRELEGTLARIWTDVLDVDHVELDDDFFDLGGHSLLAVRMFGEIHESTGRRPPIGLLFRAPTIAGLAALLDHEGWASEWTSMVRVSDGDATGVPLFVITPYLISALSFHGLAQELDGRVVYALEPHAVAAESDGRASISQVAARYVSEMKTVQPVGPYDVVGHCAGAWEALEVVGRLEDQGDEIGSLTVVDIAPPGVEPPRPSPIRYVLSRLRLYTRSGASRLLHAAWWRTRMLLLGWSARAGSGDDDTSRRAAVRDAHRRYRGRQVRADIHLIRSEEWSGLPDKDWHLRWADRSSGSLTVDTVPGSHARLLQAESLDDFAEALRRHLDV